MLRNALLFLALTTGTVAAAQDKPQLYLVTGFVSRVFNVAAGSDLFVVNTDRREIEHAANLVSSSDGSESIVVDHERRVIMLMSPRDTPKQLTIVGMNVPGKPRTMPLMLDGSLLETFFCDTSSGTLYTSRTFQPGPSWHLIGINVTGESASQRLLGAGECAFERTEGFWWPVDVFSYHDVYAKDGKLLLDWRIETRELRAPLPGDFKSAEGERLGLDIANDEIIVIGRFPRDFPGTPPMPTTHTLLIYDRKNKQWSNLVVPGLGVSIRGFGSWIAMARAERARPIPGNGVDANRNDRESPGRPFREIAINPAAGARDRVTLNYVFDEVPFYFPGELSLYNTRTKKRYVIKTDQGDSEILLVDGDSVYYRVNDSLFRATIGSNAIQNPVKLVTDENVQRSHWAFFGPPISK